MPTSTVTTPGIVSASSPGIGQIRMRWVVSTYVYNEVTYEAASYQVRYRLTTSTSFIDQAMNPSEVIPDPDSSPTESTYTLKNLPTGSYAISILALGFNDKSDPSDELLVTVIGTSGTSEAVDGFPTHITGMKSYVAFFPPFDFNYYDQEPGTKEADSDEIFGLVEEVPRLGAMLQVAWVNETFDPRRFGARDQPTNWGDGTANGVQGTLSNSTGDAGAPTTPAHQVFINNWLTQFNTLYTAYKAVIGPEVGEPVPPLSGSARLSYETTFRNGVWTLVGAMNTETATWSASAVSTTMTSAAYEQQRVIIFQAISRAQDQYQYQIDKTNRTDQQVVGEVFRAAANLANNFNAGITALQKLDSSYNGIVLINQTDPHPVNWTHVYTHVGLYWMVYEPAPGIAKAARLVKVMQRRRKTGAPPESRMVLPSPDNLHPGDETLLPEDVTSGLHIYKHDLPYPVVLDPTTEGGVDSAFAMKFSIPLNGTAREDAYLGQLQPRSGVVVFGEDDNTGQLVLIAGGFITARTLVMEPHRRSFDCVAYDPLYWMNDQYMREQQYDDKAALAYALALAQQADNSGVTAQDAQNAIDDANALEFKLNGYIGGHFLTTCRPDYAAAHIIQHLRIKVSEPGYANPAMYNLPVKSVYGNLAQFADIYVDAEFDEGAALGGFHSFAVNNGGVLSNVRQMLENTGAVFHSRSNLTFKMAKKPFYAKTLEIPTLDLLLDGAIAPVIISEGEPPKLYKIIIEKPMLAQTLNAGTTVADGDTSICIPQPPPGVYVECGFTLNVELSPVNAAAGSSLQANGNGDYACLEQWAQPRGFAFIWINPNDPILIPANNWSPGTPPTDIRGHISYPFPQCAPPASVWSTQSLALGTGDTSPFNLSDAVQGSVNPADFQYEYICGEPGGQVIGPIANVFAVDLVDFAVGMAREIVAHWQVVIPLGDYYNVDLGDIVYITVKNDPALQLDWVKKPFWVTKIQMTVDGTKHTRQITALEARPEGLIPPQDPNPIATPPYVPPVVVPPYNPGGGSGGGTTTPGSDGCISTSNGLVPARPTDIKIVSMEATGHAIGSPTLNVWVDMNWYGPCGTTLIVRGNIYNSPVNPGMETLADGRRRWKGVFEVNTHYELDFTQSLAFGAPESEPMHVSFTTPKFDPPGP